jgi:hypothetical protein
LAPSDFYLCQACGRRSGSNKCFKEAIVEDQNREFYFEGLNKFEHRWAKCIVVDGDYIEK